MTKPLDMSSQNFYFALQTQTSRGDFKPLAVSTDDAIVAAQLRAESKWWKEITRKEYKRIQAERAALKAENVAQNLVARAHKLKTKTAL